MPPFGFPFEGLSNDFHEILNYMCLFAEHSVREKYRLSKLCPEPAIFGSFSPLKISLITAPFRS